MTTRPESIRHSRRHSTSRHSFHQAFIAQRRHDIADQCLDGGAGRVVVLSRYEREVGDAEVRVASQLRDKEVDRAGQRLPIHPARGEVTRSSPMRMRTPSSPPPRSRQRRASGARSSGEARDAWNGRPRSRACSIVARAPASQSSGPPGVNTRARALQARARRGRRADGRRTARSPSRASSKRAPLSEWSKPRSSTRRPRTRGPPRARIAVADVVERHGLLGQPAHIT